MRGFPSDQAALAAKVCREEEATVFIGGDGVGREDEMDWIVVPMLKEPPVDVDLEDARIVTEGWIERCLFLNELVDVPSLTFMAKPLPAHPLRGESAAPSRLALSDMVQQIVLSDWVCQRVDTGYGFSGWGVGVIETLYHACIALLHGFRRDSTSAPRNEKCA